MFNKEQAYNILTSKELTHEQKLMQLGKVAENGVEVLNISRDLQKYFDNGSVHDLFEGSAPYRPRYIMPDYQQFIGQGSEFLKVEPPKDFDELIFALMTIYRHTPSITNFPVYLGNLDQLIEPFIENISDEAVVKKLTLFFNYLDRTITDSFSHGNMGPRESRAGFLILETEKGLQNAVPNFTLKYDPEATSDDFMKKAIEASLVCSNPAICNHMANRDIYQGEYGISSCYNILPVKGGAYTLTRLTLTRLAEVAHSVENFMEDLLPEVIPLIGDYMAQRIAFMVEKSGFFESNFLVREGFISKERFVGMFGVTGLAEAVNTLLKDEGLVYGRDEKAEELATEILDRIKVLVDQLEAPYSPLTGGKYVLHAQVGIDTDLGVTSGVRIPVGQEPEDFIEHLRHSSRYHKYFPAGVGDIFPIASHVDANLDSLLDVVKGAMKIGVHYMSFYAADSDLVRITGYLVKRSEMEKFDQNQAVLQNTTHLGAPSYKVNKLAERKVRMRE